MKPEELNAEEILPNGTRVWVFEPEISNERLSGKICGFKISVGPGDVDLQYHVDFGGGFVIWVSDFQLTGWLALVG